MQPGTPDRGGKSFGLAPPRIRRHSIRSSSCLLLSSLALYAGLLALVASPVGASDQVKPSRLYKDAAKLTQRGLVYEAVRHLQEAVKLSPKNKKFQKALVKANALASARALLSAAEPPSRTLEDSRYWLQRSIQDFHFGPGTVKVYTRAAPKTTSFRAEPCTSPPAAGPKARPSAHRR